MGYKNENTMEEKDNKIDFVKIMFWVVYLFLMILFSLSKIAAIIFCSVCVSALLVYLDFAVSKGMVGVKGHRSVGGFRASCYNAQTIEGCNALVACMKEFEAKH